MRLGDAAGALAADNATADAVGELLDSSWTAGLFNVAVRAKRKLPSEEYSFETLSYSGVEIALEDDKQPLRVLYTAVKKRNFGAQSLAVRWNGTEAAELLQMREGEVNAGFVAPRARTVARALATAYPGLKSLASRPSEVCALLLAAACGVRLEDDWGPGYMPSRSEHPGDVLETSVDAGARGLVQRWRFVSGGGRLKYNALFSPSQLGDGPLLGLADTFVPATGGERDNIGAMLRDDFLAMDIIAADGSKLLNPFMPLSGLSVTSAGSCLIIEEKETFTRYLQIEDLKAIVIRAGGSFGASVTGKTDIVVQGDLEREYTRKNPDTWSNSKTHKAIQAQSKNPKRRTPLQCMPFLEFVERFGLEREVRSNNAYARYDPAAKKKYTPPGKGRNRGQVQLAQRAGGALYLVPRGNAPRAAPP